MQPPPESLSIGPFQLHFYSICILIAVFVGYYLTKRRAPFYGISQEAIDKLLPSLLIGGIIGARLYHVLDQWVYYRQHVWEIVAIWHGGIAIYGCLAGGIIAIYFFAKRYRSSVLALFDLIAPSVLLGQAIGRWGNFFNQEAYGPPTNLPWKIFIDPVHRLPPWQKYSYFHPLFLYESLLDFAGFVALFYMAKRLKKYRGAVFALYLILYGSIRLLLEPLRYDTAILFSIRFAIIASIVSILSGTILLVKSIRSNVIVR